MQLRTAIKRKHGKYFHYSEGYSSDAVHTPLLNSFKIVCICLNCILEFCFLYETRKLKHASLVSTEFKVLHYSTYRKQYIKLRGVRSETRTFLSESFLLVSQWVKLVIKFQRTQDNTNICRLCVDFLGKTKSKLKRNYIKGTLL